MSKVLAVTAREFIARVRTKGFVISTLLMPVLLIGVFAVQIVLMSSGKDTTTHIALIDASAQQIGMLVRDNLNAETLGSGDDSKARYEVQYLRATGDVEQLRDKMIARVGVSDASGKPEIDGVLVLPEDAVTSGNMSYYGESVGSMNAMAKMRSTLSETLATFRMSREGIDPEVVHNAMRPAQLQTVKVSEGKMTDQSGFASFIIAYAMGYILFMAIMIYGQQTMTSVIEEKTSRVMEVLASSLTPFQMLLGKVLGVSAAGLLQMGIWAGTAYLLTSQAVNIAGIFGLGTDAISSLSIPSLPAPLLIIFLLYFALGFVMFGALYAAVGSMCNTIQETQQYATAITLVIMVGFFAVLSLVNDPTGELSVTMSFLPFLSPFTMPVRWSLASVPWWQLGVSVVIAVATLMGCVWLAAKIYRTGILMYGKKPSFKELWRWIRAG